MKLLFPLYLFFVLFAACNHAENSNADTSTADTNEPKRDTVNYRAVIDDANKTFTAAALKGDSAAIVAVYHPDANIYPPNEAAMDPKKMGSMIAGFAKSGITAFTLNTKEIFEGNDALTEVGTYEMGDGKKTIDKGKYITVWKKDGDKWKLFRDLWNSDNPPMPMAKK
ncbi:MAG TPA: nuclear transport factor 2 family protein [Flavitalea sp.]|nr:nuclear transport factor 2 family protein [Flavitalea sp.]